MSSRVAVLMVAALYVASQGLRAQTVLDFDSLKDGDAVTSQFAGVTFANAQALSAGFSLDDVDYPAHSGSNAIADTGGPISVAFASAISAFSGYFTHSKPIAVTAFDVAGKQLVTTSSLKNNAAVSGDGSAPNELLSLIGTNIVKIVIAGDPAGGSLVADDLSFTIPAKPVAPPYTLSVNPGSLNFSQMSGAAAPAAQQMFVTISTKNTSIPYTPTSSAAWLTVQSPGMSEQNLTVSINAAALTAGNYMGEITLTSAEAVNSGLMIHVTLTVAAAVNGVVNSGSFSTGATGSGSIASIFGANLTTQTITVTTLPLPTTLAGISATINGQPVAFYYVSPTQVNMELPFGLAAGPATLVVNANGAMTTYTVQISPVVPGLFLIGKYAAAVNFADGSINGPNAGAAPGGYVELFMTGAGDVTNPPAIGAAAVASPLSVVPDLSKVTATIGGQAATVSFAGLTPGLVDLMQVNVEVPAGLADGDYPVVVTFNGVASNSGLLRVTNP
jgi:uncharacterized protein (TIGR03437 family)